MGTNHLPLREVSIAQLYNSAERATFEIPIYQRNYAWEYDEIAALVQDVFDACRNEKPTYYIGTLVTFYKGDRVYEVIDGQQRLTTIYLLLRALGVEFGNRLTYRARRKSDDTIRNLGKPKSADEFDFEERDQGIASGFDDVRKSLAEKVGEGEQRKAFCDYFLNHVHIIHYRVPKDIDLNHYFEVMNSRGEQLEKHEIVKAQLLSKLSDAADRAKFAAIWEACSAMNVYVQQMFKADDAFWDKLCDPNVGNFADVPFSANTAADKQQAIARMLEADEPVSVGEPKERPEVFQPIIDFPNFLLIVLKMSRMGESNFKPDAFSLDDKELIKEFDAAFRSADAAAVKAFAFSLLKAKFLLDNYVVHHDNADDRADSNPWKLQRWSTDDNRARNIAPAPLHDRIVHLLSMFEVAFTARQRKNYLFYSLFFLSKYGAADLERYTKFLEWLAKKYLFDIYLVPANLSEINVPKPGSFDQNVLSGSGFKWAIEHAEPDFVGVYGDGRVRSRGIPLFVFNYMDFRLWSLYDQTLRGERSKEQSPKRRAFFDALGCDDFGLDAFDAFYFSRTRRSLEHFFPQANAVGPRALMNEAQINCFGNYAVIGAAANASGSNWSPITKLDHYLDASRKIAPVSVASLKFRIMMQMCHDNRTRREGCEWNFDDVRRHQARMVEILLAR